uniref:Uncharacterized protein n=1 Tax=Vespula pensylvanica TaxID=30213 RepID=A0A834NS46_VESPE|nr:hypothetical protein H0235_011586 [Vespula pensylvanica]
MYIRVWSVHYASTMESQVAPLTWILVEFIAGQNVQSIALLGLYRKLLMIMILCKFRYQILDPLKPIRPVDWP